MGSKSSEVTVGYKYFLTLQMGIGLGEIDELHMIDIGDKAAWPKPEGSELPPDTPITDDRVTSIQAPDLFGGEKAEGGIQGSLTVCMGKPSQVYPAWLKTLMGGRVPDFRGVVTVIFDGMLCALNPYPKAWKFRIRRALKGWDGAVWHPELAIISLDSDKIKAMNPAHILYECATNRTWGRGLPRSRINDAKWLAAATTLFNENFGLCLRWNRQDELQTFVQSVLDHIGGSIYTDRESGLLTLDLIRADYDVEDLPTFGYGNGLLSIEPEGAARENAVNEVIVNFTDPVKKEVRSVRAQNLASIQTLDSRNSTTVNYPGLPTSGLAMRVAQRDLKANSGGAKRYTVMLDRNAWRSVYPGAVIRVVAENKGILSAILRVGKVEDSPITDGQLKITAALDVFGMSATSFTDEQPNEWIPPNRLPVPVTNRYVREATYVDMVRNLNPADLALVEDTAAVAVTLAARPSVNSISYNILSRLGAESYAVRGAESWTPYFTLSAAIDHYEEELAFTSSIDIGVAAINSYLQVGDEIVYVTDIDLDVSGTSGTMTVMRSVIDTLPATHDIGTKCFFVEDLIGVDQREYVLGESVSIKLQTVTTAAVLPEASAPADVVPIVARQGKPYPPGALSLNAFAAYTVTTVTGNFDLSWSHRDRKLQQDQPVLHFEPNIGPEAGTTYNIRFYNAGTGTLIRSITGITADIIDFDGTDSDLVGNLRVEMESERDTYKSFQKYSFTFTRNLATPLALSSASVTTERPGYATVSFTTGADSYTKTVKIYRIASGVPFTIGAAVLIETKTVAPSTAYTSTDGDVVPANIVVNPGFATDTNYTKGTNWTISGGQAQRTVAAASTIAQTVALSAGVWRAGFRVVSITGGSVRARLMGGTALDGTYHSITGYKLETFTTDGTPTAVAIGANSLFAGAVDDLVLFKPSGTSAPQGVWDYYLIPYNATGNAGPVTGPLTSIII